MWVHMICMHIGLHENADSSASACSCLNYASIYIIPYYGDVIAKHKYTSYTLRLMCRSLSGPKASIVRLNILHLWSETYKNKDIKSRIQCHKNSKDSHAASVSLWASKNITFTTYKHDLLRSHN